ncbi:MAG: hypothetical protein KKF48_00150 [Nanoarchaeota archaeon]|nr:hypothetical protein [Nanoarchaeota archaeon]MBU1027435.1 hypothetical protein [Nanoarchaeota archaeon]
MFHFQTKPKICKIENWEIGGQPGEYSTVLFGGIRKITEKNKETIIEGLRTQKTLSDNFNIPASVDLFIRRKEDIKTSLDFIAKQISEPFLLDLPWGELELKKDVLEYVTKNNLQDRIIYNSINPLTDEGEVNLLKKHKIKSAILLASDITHPNADGSLNLLENRLVPYAKKANIENMLVDPGTKAFDNENMAGEVLRSIMVIKSETGLATGCAMINLIESWKYIKDKKDTPEYTNSIASANSLAQLMGADFLIYGPLKIAEHIFNSVKMTDKINAEANKGYFGLKSKIT